MLKCRNVKKINGIFLSQSQNLFVYLPKQNIINMEKISTTHLNFEEELLAAVYYNNDAKVEWLIGMD